MKDKVGGCQMCKTNLPNIKYCKRIDLVVNYDKMWAIDEYNN